VKKNGQQTLNKKSGIGKMRTILIIIGLMAGITAKPQDSLSFYMTRAARYNPAIMQKLNEYQAALQKVPQAGGLPDPELNMGMFLSPMELPGGNQVAEFRIMQMFPWFGRLRAAKDEMSMMAMARYESWRDAELQLFYEVQNAWYDMYKVQQDIRLSEKNMEILRTIERIALVKFRTAPLANGSSSSTGSALPADGPQDGSGSSQGMGGSTGNSASVAAIQLPQTMQGNSMGPAAGGSPLADLYKIQIEMGEIENNLAMLKNQQNTLMAQFNGYLNRPVTSPLALPDTLISETLGTTLSAVSDSMLANNPMLGMLRFEQRSLDARKKMVSRMGYPMIGLGLNYSVISRNEMSASAMNGKDMVMPMVTVTLPVYRKKYHAMQAEADLLKKASSENLTASANNLRTEYARAVQTYQEARRRITLYGNQSLLAGKSFDIMMKSFAVSGSGLADLLRAQQQFLDYSNKHLEAIADLNSSIAWLKRLMAFEQIQ
jgi:outer membrane protein TolC